MGDQSSKAMCLQEEILYRNEDLTIASDETHEFSKFNISIESKLNCTSCVNLQGTVYGDDIQAINPNSR